MMESDRLSARKSTMEDHIRPRTKAIKKKIRSDAFLKFHKGMGVVGDMLGETFSIAGLDFHLQLCPSPI